MDAIEIVVLDACEVARVGLRLLLSGAPGLRVVAEVADLAEARHALATQQPHVIVLGGAHKPASAANVLSLRAAHKAVAIVMVLPDNPLDVDSALAAGADGYVTGNASARELQDAVAASARGYTQRSVAKPVSSLDSQTALSPRELRLVRLMAEGYTQREVAERMQLSVRSIELLRARISQRLGLPTRAALVRYALETGLLSSRLDLPTENRS